MNWRGWISSVSWKKSSTKLTNSIPPNSLVSCAVISTSPSATPSPPSLCVELRVRVEEVVDKWKTTHQSHHSNLTLSYLTELKDVYLQLTNLLSFAELNRTGHSLLLLPPLTPLLSVSRRCQENCEKVRQDLGGKESQRVD
jgi:hypothetical protein